MLHRADEDFTDQRHQQGDAGEHDKREADRPWLSVVVAFGLRAGEGLAVGFQRKQHAQRIGDDQQHRQAQAEFPHVFRSIHEVGMGDAGGHQQRNGGEKQQASLKPGTHAVEFLRVVLESA